MRKRARRAERGKGQPRVLHLIPNTFCSLSNPPQLDTFTPPPSSSVYPSRHVCCITDHPQARLRYRYRYPHQGELHKSQTRFGVLGGIRIARVLLLTYIPLVYSALQAPVQLNSLTGTYATSTYLAALKKSPKELEALAKDLQTLDKKIKDDAKISQFLSAWILANFAP